MLENLRSNRKSANLTVAAVPICGIGSEDARFSGVGISMLRLVRFCSCGKAVEHASYRR